MLHRYLGTDFFYTTYFRSMTSIDVPDDLSHRPITMGVPSTFTPFSPKSIGSTSLTPSLGNLTDTPQKALLLFNVLNYVACTCMMSDTDVSKHIYQAHIKITLSKSLVTLIT